MIAPAEVIRPSSRDVRRLRAPRTLRALKRDGKYRITPDLRWRQAPLRALECFEQSHRTFFRVSYASTHARWSRVNRSSSHAGRDALSRSLKFGTYHLAACARRCLEPRPRALADHVHKSPGTTASSRSRLDSGRTQAAVPISRFESETGFSACRRRHPPVRGEMLFPARCGSAWPQP